MIKHGQLNENGHLQNIQSFETSVETGNLQSYDEQIIGVNENLACTFHIKVSSKTTSLN